MRPGFKNGTIRVRICCSHGHITIPYFTGWMYCYSTLNAQFSVQRFVCTVHSEVILNCLCTLVQNTMSSARTVEILKLIYHPFSKKQNGSEFSEFCSFYSLHYAKKEELICRTQEGPAYMRLSSFCTCVRPYVRLHIRFQFYPTRSIYLGPPIFLQIPDLLCIDY